MYAKRISMLAMKAGIVIALAGCQSTGSIGRLLDKQEAGFNTRDITAIVKVSADMPVGQQVMPPMGFISFCLNDPSQCEGGTDTPEKKALTPASWSELNTINDYVNTNVPQVEDIVNYGVSEHWAYPNARGGDCEDLVLLKRKMLIEHGWPASDLLIAVVREWNGDGHAILLVDTDKGELVLDNKNWAIVAWNDAPYTWIKRQSHKRPYIWVNLDKQTFRTANNTYPPLGAPIPFVVAANTASSEGSPKQTATTAPALRPSLIPTLPQDVQERISLKPNAQPTRLATR